MMVQEENKDKIKVNINIIVVTKVICDKKRTEKIEGNLTKTSPYTPLALMKPNP